MLGVLMVFGLAKHTVLRSVPFKGTLEPPGFPCKWNPETSRVQGLRVKGFRASGFLIFMPVLALKTLG